MPSRVKSGRSLRTNVIQQATAFATMHEFSIMEAALDQALEQARLAGARQVLEIRLRIGHLSGVVPEALQLAFEVLAPGTVAEHAALKIEPVPARYWCESCHREFLAERFFAECPDCGVRSRDLRSGRELELAALEIN